MKMISNVRSPNPCVWIIETHGHFIAEENGWESAWGGPAVYWQLNVGYEYRMAPLSCCSLPIRRMRTFRRGG